MEASIQANAVCAAHPGAQATGICSRCGAFVCDQCTEHGQHPTCAACRERTGEGAFPLSRNDWDVGRVFSLSWRGFSANWLSLTVGMLLMMGISWGISFVGQAIQKGAAEGGTSSLVLASILVGLVQWAIQAPLSLGFMRMAQTSLSGRHAEVGELFGQYNKLLAILGLVLVNSLLAVLAIAPVVGVAFLLREAIGTAGVVLAIVLAIVPVLWLCIPLYFAQAELALNDRCGPIDAVKNAFAVCRGQWLPALGVILLAGLAATAGLFALCIGIIPSVAFSMVVVVALYLALRNGSGIEPL